MTIEEMIADIRKILSDGAVCQAEIYDYSFNDGNSYKIDKHDIARCLELLDRIDKAIRLASKKHLEYMVLRASIS
jgi:cell division septal protein FtsQ